MTAYSTAVGVRADAAAALPSTAAAAKINMMTSRTTVRTAGLLPAIGSYRGFDAGTRFGLVGASPARWTRWLFGRVAASRVHVERHRWPGRQAGRGGWRLVLVGNGRQL